MTDQPAVVVQEREQLRVLVVKLGQGRTVPAVRGPQLPARQRLEAAIGPVASLEPCPLKTQVDKQPLHRTVRNVHLQDGAHDLGDVRPGTCRLLTTKRDSQVDDLIIDTSHTSVTTTGGLERLEPAGTPGLQPPVDRAGTHPHRRLIDPTVHTPGQLEYQPATLSR